MKAAAELEEQKRLEIEREIIEYDRKEAKRKEIMRRLERLKREVDGKQILHRFEASMMSDYYEAIDTWDEVDYNYIEYYLGAECMNRIKELDKERKLHEVLMYEQDLIESFELKRQELLLKLENAHQQFTNMMKAENESLMLHSYISHAFVFSYFDCIPDERLQNLIEKVA